MLIVALDDKHFRPIYKCNSVTLTDTAASNLAAYGAEAKSAILRILELDQQSALGAIDPWQFPLYAHGESSIQPLAVVLVADHVVQHRRRAATLLWQGRNIARPAKDALTKTLADDDEEVRITSAATLVH